MNFKKLIAFVLFLSIIPGTMIKISYIDEYLVDKKVDSKISENVQSSR